MKKIVTPAEAGRELEYNCWMKSKMPMVHITVTLDITRLLRFCKKHKGIPVNAAMCYCIGRAANQVKECHLLIKDEQIIWSDIVNVQTIVKDKEGNLRFCDLPTLDNLEDYAEQYYRLVREVYENCDNHFEDDRIFVGTSCVSTRVPVDCCVNQWNDSFQNLFLMWGAFKRTFFGRRKLTMTMQFHHVQINGGEVCQYFEILQKEINNLSL